MFAPVIEDVNNGDVESNASSRQRRPLIIGTLAVALGAVLALILLTRGDDEPTVSRQASAIDGALEVINVGRLQIVRHADGTAVLDLVNGTLVEQPTATVPVIPETTVPETTAPETTIAPPSTAAPDTTDTSVTPDTSEPTTTTTTLPTSTAPTTSFAVMTVPTDTAGLDVSGCTLARAALAIAADAATQPGAGQGILTTKIPGLDLDATFENVTATLRCNDDSLIRLTGTLRTGTIVLSADLTLSWPDTSTLVPEVRLVGSITGSADVGLVSLSDLVVPAAQMIGADLTASDLPLDLDVRQLRVDGRWPRIGPAWLDLSVGTRLRTNQQDALGVNLLVSASGDVNSTTEPTVLWGVHLDPSQGRTADLETLLRTQDLSWLGGMQFPELRLGYVTPSDRSVTLNSFAADRLVARDFFTDSAGALDENATFDATLRGTGTVRLASLGRQLQDVFGYSDDARARVSGELGLRIGDLLKPSGTLVDVTRVALEVSLPATDGAASSVMPDWLGLAETRVGMRWTPTTGVDVSLSAGARLTLPDPSQPTGVVTLTPTLDGRLAVSDTGSDVTLRLEGLTRGTAASPAWPNAFGLDWFDLVDAGTTVEVTTTSAQVTSFGVMNLGGIPTRVNLGVSSGSERTSLTLDAAISGRLSLAAVARQWGLDVSKEFDVSVGGDPTRPARFGGRLDIASDGTVTGSLGFDARSDLTIGPSTFGADMVLSLGFDADGTVSAFTGARLDATTIATVAGAISSDLGRSLATTNLGAVTLPSTGIVITSEAIDHTSTTLSTAQRAFFDPLYGCTGQPRCAYTVRLEPGVHLLSPFQMPRQPGSTTKVLFDDVYRAFWAEDSPTAQFNLSLTLPPAGQPLISAGFEAAIRLNIRPDVTRQADWFRSADLAVALKLAGTGLSFELAGDLGIRMLDETRTTAADCSAKTWVADGRPGGGGCYDELDFAVATSLQLGATSRFTLAGSIVSDKGWRQPLGIEFLEFGAVAVKLDVAVDAAGPSFQLGFYVSGKIITERGDRDLAGSMVVGLRVVATPPYVIPNFGGLRVSSRSGFDLADLMLLAGTAPSQAAGLGEPPADLPAASLRNAEFMVGTADYPDLCIATGLRFSAELYLGQSPARAATAVETPRSCTPQPASSSLDCRRAARPCDAVVGLRVGSNGVTLAGGIGRFALGRLEVTDAEMFVDLNATAPTVKVSGQAAVQGLGRGGVVVDIQPTSSTLQGSLELTTQVGGPTRLPALRASVSAVVNADVLAMLRTGDTSKASLELHVLLQSDFGALVRTIVGDAVRDFTDTLLLLDGVYQDLKANDGDVLRTLRTVPKTLYDQGVRVPLWVYNPRPLTMDLTVAAGAIDDFVTKNRLPRPTFGQIFAGTPVNPPILGITRIPGIKDFIPSAPGSFTEFLERIVEPAMDQAMQRLGAPSGYTVQTLIADLENWVATIDVPAAISCADFRLSLSSTSNRTTLRVAGNIGEHPLGIAVTWDFTKPFWDQLASVGPTLVRQLFVEPVPVTCEFAAS